MPSVAAKRVRVGRAFMDLIVAALSVDPGAAVMLTPKVHLSKDPDVVINESTVLADLTAGEADFTGYNGAGYTFTPSAPITLADGVRGVAGNILAVAGTADPQVTSTITAWWIDNGTIFVCGEKFVEGSEIAMLTPGDYIDLLAALPFGTDVRVSA